MYVNYREKFAIIKEFFSWHCLEYEQRLVKFEFIGFALTKMNGKKNFLNF